MQKSSTNSGVIGTWVISCQILFMYMNQIYIYIYQAIGDAIDFYVEEGY